MMMIIWLYDNGDDNSDDNGYDKLSHNNPKEPFWIFQFAHDYMPENHRIIT